MARFATHKIPRPVYDAVNASAAPAIKASPKLAFAQAVLTSMTKDTYYQSGTDNVSWISKMARELEDPLFAAKAAVFTRHDNGLRSVSHVVAAALATRTDVKGQPWLRSFYKRVVRRPDDITETLALMKASDPKLRKLSNALKRGFGDAMTGFDEYQLAKYLRKDRDPNLIDAVNLLHPKSTPALQALMTGTLKPAETWETKVSAAGKAAASQGLDESGKTALKGAAYAELLRDRKMGYMAVLRNLRNIASDAPEALPLALDFLTDPAQVKKSLVLPLQFYTAQKALVGSPASTTAVKKALEKAMQLSLSNAPVFEGPTLLAVDVSGSMKMGNGPIEVAALMAAVLYRSQPDADLMLFDGSSRYLTSLNPDDSLSTLTQTLSRLATGGSTNFASIFETAHRAYARIVILSDNEANGSNPIRALGNYRSRMKADPRVYVFNLNAVSGTLQFPENKVYSLAGFSDTVLGLMKNLEADPQALVHEIEKVVL